MRQILNITIEINQLLTDQLCVCVCERWWGEAGGLGGDFTKIYFWRFFFFSSYGTDNQSIPSCIVES